MAKKLLADRSSKEGLAQSSGPPLPYFEKTLIESNIPKPNSEKYVRLIIPSDYCKKNLNKDAEMSLRFQQNPTEVYKVLFAYSEKKGSRFGKGWAKACRGEKLEAGDVLIFRKNSHDENDLEFTVHVKKAVKVDGTGEGTSARAAEEDTIEHRIEAAVAAALVPHTTAITALTARIDDMFRLLNDRHKPAPPP